MSDLMNMKVVAFTRIERELVDKISEARSIYPRNLRARVEYYKKLFDRSVNNRNYYITPRFKKEFSLFLSNTIDSVRQVEKEYGSEYLHGS